MAEETEESPNSGQGRRLKTAASIIGVLAAVAGIATAVVTLWPKSPFTLADWAKRADSVCGETSGDAAEAARAANDALAQTVVAWRQNTATADYFVQSGNLYYKMAGLQDKQAADLSEIPNPNEKSAVVEGVIRDMRTATHSIYFIAETLRAVNVQNPAETVDQVAQAAESYNSAGKSVNDRLAKLGADECVPPVNAP